VTIREGAAAALRAVPQLDARTVDRVFVVLAGWLMTGVFLDAWAHISGLPDSFWTPWHGVLYSGLTACGAFVFAARYLQRDGAPALHRGYDLSVIGFGVAALGGVADGVWHTIFGVEFDVEAAVSPSHLMVAFGILLLVTGPMRVAWDRRSFTVPAMLSTIYGMSILAVILDYANPFNRLFGASLFEAALDQTVALFSFMLYAAIVVGFLLLNLRRLQVSASQLGAIVGANMLAMVLVNGPLHPLAVPHFIAVSIAGALLVTLAASWLRPMRDRVTQLRAFSFLVPVLMYAAYPVAIIVGAGTAWSVTFWSGLIVSSAITGLLLSSLAIDG
jgi:hypothetical protein